MLRDPTGRSLHRNLLERPHGSLWHFPSEPGDDLVMPNEGWVTGRADIAAAAPFMERQVIYDHWQRYALEVSPTTRSILDDAYQRVIESDRLLGFGYHPNEDAQLPRTAHGGTQRSVYFRFRAPASQSIDKSYKCWIECLTACFPNSHPFVTKVIRGGCECPLGQSAECVHILMCALTVHLLPRPAHILGASSQPTTSVLCAWADPGKGAVYDVTTPLACIPFIRVKMKTKKTTPLEGPSRPERILQVCLWQSHSDRQLVLTTIWWVLRLRNRVDGGTIF